MAKDIDKVVAVLKYLGIAPDVNSYLGRFTIQKVVFIAQTLGIPFSYYFTLYVAGPYSPALAQDYYANPERIESLETNYELGDDEKRILKKLKESKDLFDDPSNFQLLESTATAIYLIKMNNNISEGDLIMQMKQLKPHLSDETIILGINRAKRILFKPEYLTKELREEIEMWDQIDE
ncbi:MAG: hypothetical protein ACP6IS_10360 [Candidatus Asgardarchaeia archaeon]